MIKIVGLIFNKKCFTQRYDYLFIFTHNLLLIKNKTQIIFYFQHFLLPLHRRRLINTLIYIDTYPVNKDKS